MGRYFPRILEIIPLSLGSLLWQGAPIGWGIAYGIILIGKYFAAKWAFGRFTTRNHTVVISVLAVVMIPWEGQWRAHDVPMQTSAMFMILAAGTILRCRDGLTLQSAILTPIWIAASFASYEALLVVSLTLPIMVALSPGRSAWPSVLGRTYPLVLVPLLAFLAISIDLAVTSGSRLTAMMTYPIHPYDHVREAFKLLYLSSLVFSPLAVVALPLFAFLLCDNCNKGDGFKLATIALIAIAVLPLSAIPFVTTYSYINDTERVGVPIGFGFFILCSTLAMQVEKEMRSSVATVLMVCLALSAVANAYTSWRPYGELQQPVLDQVTRLLKNEIGKHVIVRDMTNRLGDVFTFQSQTVFHDALQVRGVDPKDVDLCLVQTAPERYLPEFIKLDYPSSPIPLCQAPSKDDAVLDVQWRDRKPFVVKIQ